MLAATLPDDGEVLLRNAEVDEDRTDLIDDDERNIVRLHEIPGMHEEVACSTGNR